MEVLTRPVGSFEQWNTSPGFLAVCVLGFLFPVACNTAILLQESGTAPMVPEGQALVVMEIEIRNVDDLRNGSGLQYELSGAMPDITVFLEHEDGTQRMELTAGFRVFPLPVGEWKFVQLNSGGNVYVIKSQPRFIVSPGVVNYPGTLVLEAYDGGWTGLSLSLGLESSNKDSRAYFKEHWPDGAMGDR